MKHKKLLAYAFLPVFGLGLLTAGSASAHGLFGGFGMGGFANVSSDEMATHHQTMFQKQADLIGASVDEVKNAWAEGKNFMELAKEKGLTEEQIKTKMKEAHQAQLKAGLQTLVDKGIITQTQADKRLTLMQTKTDKMHAKMGKRMMRGIRF